MKRTTIILTYLLLVMVLKPVARAFSEESLQFRVERGDALSTLCIKYLEDPHRWRDVAKANHLRNPDLIMPGQILRVPVSLLKGIPVEGRIAFIKGDVRSRAEGGTEWLPLHLNDMLRQGTMIKTADEGPAELAFGDGTSLSLKSNTILEITDARDKWGLQIIRKFFLRAGRVATRVQGITGRESRFEIRTPSAVAAARGTEFRTTVDFSEATRSEVLHGVVGVQAMGKSVDVQEGEGTVVLKNYPPMQPKKLLPPPGLINGKPIYKSLPFAFTFENIEGAVSYRVLLARDKDMKDVIQEKIMKPQETLEIIGVEDGVFFLQSSSIDDIGLEGAPSSPIEISVRVNPLPPIIQSPHDGADYRERSVGVAWLKVMDAKQYQIQIAEDKDFRKIIQEKTVVQDPELRTKDLEFKTYYFRLRSIAGDDYEGEWSDIRSFSLVPPPPAPTVEKPLIDKNEMSFGWNNLGQGITYHVQLAGDPEFNNIITDKTVDKPMISLQRPEQAGTYYIRTSSIDAKGYEGKFSAAQSFEIKKRFPYEVLGVIATIGLIFLFVP